MEEWEFDLKKMMEGEAPVNGDKMESLRRELVAAFDRKEKKIRWIFLGYRLALLGLFAIFLGVFLLSTNMKTALLYGILALMMMEGIQLMKMWYWVMHTKISTIREIKQLQLQFTELLAKLSASDS